MVVQQANARSAKMYFTTTTKEKKKKWSFSENSRQTVKKMELCGGVEKEDYYYILKKKKNNATRLRHIPYKVLNNGLRRNLEQWNNVGDYKETHDVSIVVMAFSSLYGIF